MLDLPGGCVRPVCHQGASDYVAVGSGVLITEEGWGRSAGQGGIGCRGRAGLFFLGRTLSSCRSVFILFVGYMRKPRGKIWRRAIDFVNQLFGMHQFFGHVR